MKNNWTMWLAGILASILTTAVITLANATVNNDKDARVRDDVVNEKLVKATSEQNAINSQILVQLAKIDGRFETIQLDLSYIKKNIKNGNP